MPEYWFKYGVTEVSMEIPGEIRHRRMELGRGELSEEAWIKVRELAEDLVKDLGSGWVTLVYDHSGDSFTPLVLKHLVESMSENLPEDRIRLLTSCWRLDRSAGFDHMKKEFKRHGIKAKFIEAAESEKAHLNGLKISKDILGSSATVIITASEPHGLLGKASIKEALALGGYVEAEQAGEASNLIEEIWESLSSRLSMQAITNLNGEIHLGDASEIEKEISEKKFDVSVEDFDAVIAGSGGYPKDSILRSVVHVLGLLRGAVRDDGLIGVIAECKGGVGDSFLDMLLRNEGSGLEWELVKLAREVIEEKRVVFTTSLPRSILKNLLGVRGFDSPQDMLTYVLRLYSREAGILILEEPKLRPVRRIGEG